MKSSEAFCVATGLAVVIAYGGCTAARTSGTPNETVIDRNTDTSAETETGTGSLPGDSWVNIMDVAVTGSDGAYTFNVEFKSADIDCSQFADWWEVVTEDGILLYRRILAHPHTPSMTGNPVARSGGPVAATADQTVIVRGHMNNAGYLGIPMRGSVTSGFVQAPDIDASFAPGIEKSDPQPETCIPEADIAG